MSEGSSVDALSLQILRRHTSNFADGKEVSDIINESVLREIINGNDPSDLMGGEYVTQTFGSPHTAYKKLRMKQHANVIKFVLARYLKDQGVTPLEFIPQAKRWQVPYLMALALD